MNSTCKTIVTVFIFCIAMAALEGAVVVYLRALYYPNGFTVALKIIDEKILLTEITREAATVVMLITIGFLAGCNFKDRLAYFLMAFAVWDIFYYVWLKVFLDWPSSVLEWDILFLIPFTWLGPVLAPLLCSSMMLVLSFVILRGKKPLTKVTWAVLLMGSATVLYTFLRDYGKILITNKLLGEYFTIMQNKQFLGVAKNYIPKYFAWDTFILGALLILAGTAKVAFGEWKPYFIREASHLLPLLRRNSKMKAKATSSGDKKYD